LKEERNRKGKGNRRKKGRKMKKGEKEVTNLCEDHERECSEKMG